MKKEYEYLWDAYNAALSQIRTNIASRTASGLESEYGNAAKRLMRAGELYKIKAKYRGGK